MTTNGSAVFASDRTFQLWFFTVSHSKLLLRSTKNDKFSTQVDVLFTSVSALRMLTLFDGLNVLEVQPSSVDLSLIGPTSSLKYGTKLFQLSGVGWDGFVLGGAMFWVENELDFFDKSPLLPDLSV